MLIRKIVQTHNYLTPSVKPKGQSNKKLIGDLHKYLSAFQIILLGSQLRNSVDHTISEFPICFDRHETYKKPSLLMLPQNPANSFVEIFSVTHIIPLRVQFHHWKVSLLDNFANQVLRIDRISLLDT